MKAAPPSEGSASPSPHPASSLQLILHTLKIALTSHPIASCSSATDFCLLIICFLSLGAYSSRCQASNLNSSSLRATHHPDVAVSSPYNLEHLLQSPLFAWYIHGVNALGQQHHSSAFTLLHDSSTCVSLSHLQSWPPLRTLQMRPNQVGCPLDRIRSPVSDAHFSPQTKARRIPLLRGLRSYRTTRASVRRRRSSRKREQMERQFCRPHSSLRRYPL